VVAKFAATTGMVFAALVLVRNNANMNSCHAVMNEKTAAATRPGAATGRNTAHDPDPEELFFRSVPRELDDSC
jgi:hypothetical protein